MRKDEFPLVDKIREDAYQQGREDAIAEMIRLDAECQALYAECPHFLDEIDCIQCIAERMKEKKDDN